MKTLPFLMAALCVAMWWIAPDFSATEYAPSQREVYLYPSVVRWGQVYTDKKGSLHIKDWSVDCSLSGVYTHENIVTFCGDGYALGVQYWYDGEGER